MINILENKSDNAFLKRKKKSIAKKFGPTKSKTIEEANQLCTYLVVLGRTTEVYEVLKSYVEEIPFVENRWERRIATCQGILLLAYLEKLMGNMKEATRLNNIVIDNDYYPYIRSSEKDKYFLELVEGFNSTPNMIDACDIAHSEVCGIYAELFLNFLYFEQLHRSIETFSDDHKEILQDTVEDLKKILASFILNGKKANK